MSVKDYFSRDVRLRHLRIMVAIEEAGQLTLAARKLHITQSALSKALAEIEQSIGQPLFHRMAKGVSPTQAGAALLRAARATLVQLETANTEIADLNLSERRTLAIGVMPTGAMTFMAAAIAQMQSAYPDLVLRVVEGGTPITLPQLQSGALDLVIGAQMRPALLEGIDMQPLYDDLMHPVVAQGHLLLSRPAPTWEELLAWPWILPPMGHSARVLFDRAMRQLGLPKPARVVESMALDLVLPLLRLSQGINLMPGRLADALDGQGGVAKVPGNLGPALGIALPVKVYVRQGSDKQELIRFAVRSIQVALGLGPLETISL